MTPSPRGETDPRIADFRSLRRRSRAVQARLDAGIVIPRAVEQQPVQLHWIVTLLATDDVAGLQVQRRSGGWIDVPALPDDFVCNIGDCLMRWSNDVYASTPHRVRPPARVRRSIALFLDPNPDALVARLDGTAARKGGL